MPTVLRVGRYRFFFFSNENNEPPHIHVERDDYTAKFWLDPIRLETSGGFSRGDIRRIQDIVTENRERLLRSWHDYFSD